MSYRFSCPVGVFLLIFDKDNKLILQYLSSRKEDTSINHFFEKQNLTDWQKYLECYLKETKAI